MNYSNKAEDCTPLSYESVKSMIDDMRQISNKPVRIQRPVSSLPPMSPDTYYQISDMANALNEDFEFVAWRAIRGIYRQHPAYCCSIAAYRAFETEMREF